ncbi:MAG: hypothetical protein ACJA0H_001157 [Francisellaceae bacterium]|jgi:hypothetical protein
MMDIYISLVSMNKVKMAKKGSYLSTAGIFGVKPNDVDWAHVLTTQRSTYFP